MDMPVASAFGGVTPAEIVPLTKLFRLFRRFLWLILLCAILGAVAAYAYASTKPKLFTSSAMIAVQGDRFAIPELEGALRGDDAPDPMPIVRTEVQALGSRELVQQVVTQLHLDRLPEFNPALRPPTPIQRIEAAITSLLPHKAAASTGLSPDEAVLLAAQHALVVSQDNRSLVIGVAFSAQNPTLAARFVNKLVADYLSRREQVRVDADARANEVLNARIDQVRASITGIENQMRELRGKSDLVGLRAGSVSQQELESLAAAAAAAEIDRAQIQASWERASALARSGSSGALASVLDSPTISQLRDQEAVAASRLATLESSYGSNYPGVRSARAEYAATKRALGGETQRIVASLRSQLDVASAHEAEIQQQLAAARIAAMQTQNGQAQLTQLQQEDGAQQKVYQTLLGQMQQTAAQPSKSQVPDVRVLSNAVPSGLPSAPNMKLASGFGLIGGGFLGCLLALTRIGSAEGFANEADVADATGMAVLATVPRCAGRQSLFARVSARPSGPDAELMRQLRTRLLAASRPRATRSVVFTAAADGIDAPALAAAFALAAAADGERVLLVEGDLRRPALAGILGSQDGDLVSVLEGRADWRDSLTADREVPLHLLLGGGKPVDPHALLSGTRLQNMLVEAGEDYDLIVFDAPPAGEAEALALARRADTTILVVSARRASRAATRDVSQRLASMSRSPIFAVLAAMG